MELELGLALPNSHLMLGVDLNSEYTNNTTSRSNFCTRKRGFEDAFPEVTPPPPPPPPLFVSKDDGAGGNRQLRSTNAYNCGGSKVLVGWPPVKLPRRKSCAGVGGGGAEERILDGEDEAEGGAGGRANCVKVKMEGVAIGRKVDLSLHDSYEALFRTLNQMFPKKLLDGEVAYDHKHTVTYEDGDGDWMLVGDVPWEAFIQSVKRLKILH